MDVPQTSYVCMQLCKHAYLSSGKIGISVAYSSERFWIKCNIWWSRILKPNSLAYAHGQFTRFTQGIQTLKNPLKIKEPSYVWTAACTHWKLNVAFDHRCTRRLVSLQKKGIIAISWTTLHDPCQLLFTFGDSLYFVNIKLNVPMGTMASCDASGSKWLFYVVPIATLT